MAYLKPSGIVNAFNTFAKLITQKVAFYGVQTLVVAGRSTGTEQTVPVIPVDFDGARYIVSTRGESEWVRNVRKVGTVELRDKGKPTTYTASEVPVAEREPIIAAYRKKAGQAVSGYWKKLPDAVDHPTFRLAPV
jgi:deazaflavin-dependent oxidoreductase (nitroreductase family)